jgi:hypothetical protein
MVWRLKRRLTLGLDDGIALAIAAQVFSAIAHKLQLQAKSVCETIFAVKNK